MPQVTLFISAVSHEFASYREALRQYLTRHDVTVKVQEDFKANGDVTTEKLDTYVQSCDAVIQLAGDQPGYPLNEPSRRWLLARYPQLAVDFPSLAEVLNSSGPASYTQCEAYLALLHEKTLLIAQPTALTTRDHSQSGHAEPVQTQTQHLERLRRLGRYPEIAFDNPEQLVAKLSVSVLLDLLLKATNPVQPRDLPYRSLGPLFKGREADLHALRARLTAPAAPAALALTGLGGVGKTRLAVEYAWQYRPDYTALLLVSADSPATLEANLAALAGPRVLNLPEQVAPEQETRLAAVRHWLAQHPGWLLVLDNVDTPEAAAAVEDWLPRLDGGRLLLTTRFSEFSPQVEPLELGVLSEAAAAEFLLARTDHRIPAPTDAADARALAHLLGGLALALEQAGAYVNTRRISLHAYQQLWQTNARNVRAWSNEQLMRYPRSVAVTWQTSFDQLSDDARTLLARLAWLAPDSIPRTLLETPVPAAAPLDAEEVLVELARYSLARFTEEGLAFTVHPLVQEVAREQQGQAQLVLQQVLEWLSDAFRGDPSDVRSWPTLAPLLPHALAIIDNSSGVANPEVLAVLLNQTGLLLKSKAQFQPAEALYRRALAMKEAANGPNHVGNATVLNNLAKLLDTTNRRAEAEALYRHALHLKESAYGADHLEVAGGLSNLAVLLEGAGRSPEAEPLLRRALAITEAHYPANHPSVAICFSNLAASLEATGRLAEAEPLYRRALAIQEAAHEPDHPHVATGLHNLGALLLTTGRPTEAEPLCRRALHIKEAGYGADHPEAALSMHLLATLLLATSRPAEAEPLYRRALATWEASYGPTHPDVVTGLHSLADTLLATSRLTEAEPLYRRALAIQEASHGPAHPEVAISLNKLAGLLKTGRQVQEAEQLYQRALAIWEATYGTEHAGTVAMRDNLAALGRANPALQYWAGPVNSARYWPPARSGSDYTADEAGTIIALYWLSAEPLINDYPHFAEPLMRRALALSEAHYDPMHPDVATSLNALAWALAELDQPKEEEARALHRRAQAIRQAHQQP